MSTTETALTAHLVMTDGACHPRFLGEACKELQRRFAIHHATLQVEPPEAGGVCRLAPRDVV